MNTMEERPKPGKKIYGLRPIIEAIKSGSEIEKVFIKKGLGGELFRELFKLIRDHNIPFQHVPQEKLNKLTSKNHQGVVAMLSPVEFVKLDQLIPMLFEKGKAPLVLVLDSITDVRNFGAILRSAECAGADAVVVPMKNTAAINADAIKASAGAIFNIDLCRVPDIASSLRYLKDCGLKVVGATEKSTSLYTEVDYQEPMALVMGAEDTGISRENLQIMDFQVSIPVTGQTKSLNVSVAAGVLLYEVLRQRNA